MATTNLDYHYHHNNAPMSTHYFTYQHQHHSASPTEHHQVYHQQVNQTPTFDQQENLAKKSIQEMELDIRSAQDSMIDKFFNWQPPSEHQVNQQQHHFNEANHQEHSQMLHEQQQHRSSLKIDSQLAAIAAAVNQRQPNWPASTTSSSPERAAGGQLMQQQQHQFSANKYANHQVDDNLTPLVMNRKLF